MKTPILLLAAAVTLAACSRNPDPEYAPAADDAPAEAVAPAAPAAATPAPPAAGASVSDEDAMRIGRDAAEKIFARDFTGLWPSFDEAVQMQAQSAENFGQMVGQIFDQVGTETTLVGETIVRPEQNPDIAVYRRRGFYANIGMNLDLYVAVNPNGSIGGVNIGQADE